MRKAWLALAMAAVLVTVSGAVVQAADADWRFEVTPYVWVTDVDGTVTLHDHVEAKRSAYLEKNLEDDAEDDSDLSVSVLGLIRYRRVVGLAQLDVLPLNESRYHAEAIDDTITNVRMHSQIGTAAIGWQFQGAWASVDVLAGFRYLRLDVEMDNSDGRTWDDTATLTDPLLAVRPSIQLFGPVRFNPNMAIGGAGGNHSGGGSKLTYELQPEIQIDFGKNVSAQLGYRYTYYECRDGLEYDGSFEGFLAGLGIKF